MRRVFVDELTQYAKNNNKIVLITGDLGYSILENFQNNFSERFINAGIAEQNMTGFAAGLALSGKIPFTYSIVNFSTLRCLEQIRNDICYHGANVKIVGVGSGFSYGVQGYTHHALEDISIMRSLPNMNVFSPACCAEVRYSLSEMLKIDGPCYLRLGKAEELENIDKLNSENSFPAVFPLITGYNHTILSTGEMTQKIYQWLKEKKYPISLYSIPVIKPMALEMLAEIVNQSKTVVTIEEHTLCGGFGSAVLENIYFLYNQGKIINIPKFSQFGVQDCIKSNITSQHFLEDIIDQVENFYKRL